jgi:hypothetical protein
MISEAATARVTTGVELGAFPADDGKDKAARRLRCRLGHGAISETRWRGRLKS